MLIDLSDCRFSVPALDRRNEQALQDQLARWEAWCAPMYPDDLQAAVSAALMVYPPRQNQAEIELSVILDQTCMALQDLPAWAVQQGLNRAVQQHEYRPTPAAIRKLCEEEAGADLKVRSRLRTILSVAPRRETAGEPEEGKGEKFSQLSEEKQADFAEMMARAYASLRATPDPENPNAPTGHRQVPDDPKFRIKGKQFLPDGRWVEAASMDDLKAAHTEMVQYEAQFRAAAE